LFPFRFLYYYGSKTLSTKIKALISEYEGVAVFAANFGRFPPQKHTPSGDAPNQIFRQNPSLFFADKRKKNVHTKPIASIVTTEVRYVLSITNRTTTTPIARATAFRISGKIPLF